jgi:hypothetical protein
MFFQNPPYKASRELLISRIATVGTSFSPLPFQTWHGYGVTSAHRVEVEVGADGHASAPPSGVAAAAPPAGAQRTPSRCSSSRCSSECSSSSSRLAAAATSLLALHKHRHPWTHGGQRPRPQIRRRSISIATEFPTNKFIYLRNLSLHREETDMIVRVKID